MLGVEAARFPMTREGIGVIPARSVSDSYTVPYREERAATPRLSLS